MHRLSNIHEEQNIAAIEASVITALVLFFGLFPLLPTIWVIGLEVAAVGLTLFSWLRGWQVAVPVGVFCSVCIFCVVIGVPFSQIWLGFGLIVYIIICKKSKRLSENISWLKFGRLGLDVFMLSAIFVFFAALALIFWFSMAKPDIKDLIDKFLPDWNYAFLVVGGLLFSIFNAAVEEGAYRGVIMHGLDRAFGPGKMSISIQAAVFGTLHINGFPRGWSGVLLASIFGLFMGTVRRKANGMLAPWIAHIFVDIVICCIVAIFAFTT